MFHPPQKILDKIPEGARVLDIGGAEEIFPRANAVIDILPYEQRKPGPLDLPEQFTKEDWYVGDICSSEIWDQFEDNEFDFVLCSHTLEDVRDPIFLCRQINRVGKAGYIEIPSRFRECAKGHPLDSLTGWEHHRWIIDLQDDCLVFTPKNPLVHRFDFLFRSVYRKHLSNPFLSALAFFWEDQFHYTEHMGKGWAWEIENVRQFYKNFTPEDVPKEIPVIKAETPPPPTFRWVTEFRIPAEDVPVEEFRSRHKWRKYRLAFAELFAVFMK